MVVIGHDSIVGRGITISGDSYESHDPIWPHLLVVSGQYPQPAAGGVPVWYTTNFASDVVSQIVNELRKTLHIIIKWYV